MSATTEPASAVVDRSERVVMIVECQTCTAKALWVEATDGTAWAIHHSRATGHPDNYRVKALDPEAVRGRVWQDPDDNRWRWTVQQPGLVVAWGESSTLPDAAAHCRRLVGLYRRLPVQWTADDE